MTSSRPPLVLVTHYLKVEERRFRAGKEKTEHAGEMRLEQLRKSSEEGRRFRAGKEKTERSG
jgi:hypothetical protein